VRRDTHLDLGDIKAAAQEWRQTAALYADIGNPAQLARMNAKLMDYMDG
jgi:hypothetical protein